MDEILEDRTKSLERIIQEYTRVIVEKSRNLTEEDNEGKIIKNLKAILEILEVLYRYNDCYCNTLNDVMGVLALHTFGGKPGNQLLREMRDRADKILVSELLKGISSELLKEINDAI